MQRVYGKLVILASLLFAGDTEARDITRTTVTPQAPIYQGKKHRGFVEGWRPRLQSWEGHNGQVKVLKRGRLRPGNPLVTPRRGSGDVSVMLNHEVLGVYGLVAIPSAFRGRLKRIGRVLVHDDRGQSRVMTLLAPRQKRFHDTRTAIHDPGGPIQRQIALKVRDERSGRTEVLRVNLMDMRTWIP